MTTAADLVATNGEVHTLAPPPGSPWGDGPGDETYEAVAVRDGEVVRVGSAYEVGFLAGVATDVVDLDGRVLLPGFVDAHTHLETAGRYLVHADLSGAASVDEAVETLRRDARDDRAWMLGFGWDETGWPAARYLRRADLDRVSDERPVAAMRVDMHTAALNSVALDRLGEALPDEDVAVEDGRPTGVVVEDAVGAVFDAAGGGVAGTRELLAAARDRCHELGITGVHEKVRDSHAPRVYRELDRADELRLRVRIDYWSDHLDAVVEAGLRTGHGSEMVRVGGVKSFTDGSIGGRTARLTEPYADRGAGSAPGRSSGRRRRDDGDEGEPRGVPDPPGDRDQRDDGDDGEAGGDPESRSGAGDERDDGGLGRWVVDPGEFRTLVARVDDAGLQMVTHAIGDAAIEEAMRAYEATDDPGASRHRIEHVELAGDEHLRRMADAGVVASCQPNFLRWADEGGLYEQRLGPARTARSNRFRDLLDAGVPLAFGSDCMPLGPLEGVHHAVDAPVESQRLTVTEALRAYTYGAAYAGGDEHRLGTVEPGKKADFVVLERSPWEREEAIRDVDVALTIVDGEVVYDGR